MDRGNPLTNRIKLLTAPGYGVLLLNQSSLIAAVLEASGQGGTAPRQLFVNGAGKQVPTEVGMVYQSAGASNDSLQVPAPSSALLSGVHGTILALYRRKTASTDGAAYVIAGSGSTCVNVFLPYSDGNAYWDFGGTSSPNRVSVSGLTYTKWSAWVFTAGRLGSQIYQDGKPVATSATAITRTNTDTGAFSFCNNSSTADSQTAIFAYLEANWDSSYAREWSRNPWQLFAPQQKQPSFFLPPAGVTSLPPRSLNINQAVHRSYNY